MKGKRACWLLTEGPRNKWQLSLEVGNKSFKLDGYLFNDPVVAHEALDTLNVVVVHMKEKKHHE